jgi:hypothetical protein
MLAHPDGDSAVGQEKVLADRCQPDTDMQKVRSRGRGHEGCVEQTSHSLLDHRARAERGKLQQEPLRRKTIKELRTIYY